MDRDIPNYNQLVTNKIQQKHLALHYQRLHNIKNSTHSRIPSQTYNHSLHNRKAIQKQQEQKTQIQKNNLMLFNKMRKIMKRNDPCNQPTQPHRQQLRTSIQLQKIQEQNRTMYERLEKQKPTIDNRKLQEERKKKQNILKFLGKYSALSQQNMQQASFRASHTEKSTSDKRSFTPAHYLDKTTLKAAIEMKAKRYQHSQLQDEIDQDQMQTHLQLANRAQKVYSSTQEPGLNPRSRPYDNFETAVPLRSQIRTAPHSAKDIILFKTKKQLNGQLMQVSIVRCHLSYEIRARDLENSRSQSYKLILNQTEGNELLQISNYNYNLIVSRLVLKNEQLQLTIEQEQQETVEEQHSQATNFTPFSKPSAQILNNSHISEQNEEESYRPNESVHQESPTRPQKRLDSLGLQDSKQMKEESQEDALSDKVAETSPKKQQQQFKVYDSSEVPLEYSVEKKRQAQITFNPYGISNYEQALQQQII